MKFCSNCSFEAVGGLEARGIWARDQIGDGIIELLSLRESRRGTSRLRGFEVPWFHNLQNGGKTIGTPKEGIERKAGLEEGKKGKEAKEGKEGKE